MSWNIAKPGDQINGPANITGNLTVDTNTLFVDSVNNRVGVLTTSPTVPLDVVGNAKFSGTLSVQGRDIKSSIRAAAGDYASVAFDGATLATRVTSTLTGQNIGTGDFSLWSRFRVPELGLLGNNPGVIGLGPNSSDNGGNNSFRVGLLSTGSLYLRANDGSGVTTNGDITGFVSAYTGQVVDLVITRTGSTLKVYVNGTDTAYTGALSASNSITSSYCSVGIGSTSSAVFNGPIYRSVLFNRALSAADVSDLIETGVNPADQWGTQTQLINATTENGGFETAGAGGADVFASWIETTSGTSTINRDTSVFYAGAASCRFDLDASGSGALVTNSNVDYVRGKRFRVSCYARGTATLARIGVNVGEASYQPLGAVLDNASWQYRSLEFVCGSGGPLDVVVARYAGSVSGSIWLDNFTVERIGAIVDLDFTVGAGYQATDRSNNALHGTLFNGVSFTDPKRAAIIYATTSTSGNQQMLGSLAIPTNAFIEDIIVNSTGTATVSVGNASAGTQIVNAASVVAGRQKLTVATPFSATGNLWVNSSSTATLQFTILYTIAA